MKDHCLLVDDLCVGFPSKRGYVSVVNHASLSVARGEVLGLIGESGSGKSMLARACFGLLPTSGAAHGKILIDGESIIDASEAELRRIRGRKIAMIFQNPGRALNPFFTIGQQVIDIVARSSEPDESLTPTDRVLGALDRVGMSEPEALLAKYPHQFSGGQLQRIAIAMALACSPPLIIADEPTTALDVTIQAQILELIKELVAERALAVLFITHDLGVLATIADRIAVMRDGQILETRPAADLYAKPGQAYTKELLAAVPKIDLDGQSTQSDPKQQSALLEVRDLTKTFESSSGSVYAVRGIDFEIGAGDSIALVGESGSGKSTAAMAVLNLIKPSDGRVVFAGADFLSATHTERRALRQSLGIVFQNPYSSLNPRMRVRAIISEGLKVAGGLSPAEIESRVVESIEQVGLERGHLNRFPHAFSGGQRQRIAIARALVTRPQLIVLDEPTAALDVIVQAQILRLLEDLRRKNGLSYLFITHDLAAVQEIADRVMVMYLGQIVEEGPVSRVFANPRHPYTHALLEAAPIPDPNRIRDFHPVPGEIPSPRVILPGCSYAGRCPKAQPKCEQNRPQLLGEIHRAACFFPNPSTITHLDPTPSKP